METSNRKEVAWLLAGLCTGLLLMGALRFSAGSPTLLTPLAVYATPGYILLTVFFAVMFVRAGLPLNRFGFGVRPTLRHLLLAIAAIAVLRLTDFTLTPWIEGLLGSTRNLERFDEVQGSASALVALLFMNWTFAAFGEEFAYRILLMRAISFTLGDSRSALILALLVQALIFGLVHAYQGPVGIVGATISGLIFGAVTIAGRFSIWPSALAHGVNNTIGILAIYGL